LRIHQHELVRTVLHALHALCAVLGEVDVDAGGAEQLERHLLIELVVFDE
jgi:hypothetical protein